MSVHVIHFAGSITAVSSQALRDIWLQALQQNASELRIHLSCDGGSNFYGFSLFNFLRSIPVPLTIHNIGNIESMGVVVYLAGQRRLANLHSRFLIHPLHWDFGQARIDLPRLNEFSARLNDDVERYAKIFEEVAGASCQQKLDIRPHLTSNHRLMDSQSAVVSGLCQEITEATLPSDSVKWWVQSNG